MTTAAWRMTRREMSWETRRRNQADNHTARPAGATSAASPPLPPSALALRLPFPCWDPSWRRVAGQTVVAGKTQQRWWEEAWKWFLLTPPPEERGEGVRGAPRKRRSRWRGPSLLASSASAWTPKRAATVSRFHSSRRRPRRKGSHSHQNAPPLRYSTTPTVGSAFQEGGRGEDTAAVDAEEGCTA